MNGNPYGSGGGNPGAALGVTGLIVGIVYLVVLIFFLYLWARIFRKAGYSGWLTLLLLVPLVNLGVIIWFAFANWPVQQRAMGAGAGGTPPYTPPSYMPPSATTSGGQQPMPGPQGQGQPPQAPGPQGQPPGQ